MKTINLVVAVFMMLALVGCGSAPAVANPNGGVEQAPAGGPTDGQQPGAPSGPSGSTQPVDETRVQAEAMLQAMPTLSATAQKKLVEQAKVDLGTRLVAPLSGGTTPDATTLEPKQISRAIWPDGGMGCQGGGAGSGAGQAPGMVPGYIILFEAGGQTYEYHVGADNQVVYCPEPVTPLVITNKLVELARLDLSGWLSVDVASIDLVSFSGITWPDTSLGCPLPDLAYAQVVVPGYLIVFDYAGQKYEYHASQEGQYLLCDADQSQPGISQPGKTQPGGNTQPGGITQPGVTQPGGITQPGAQNPPADSLQAALVSKAVQDLSMRLMKATTEIALVESQEMLWPDASLGCPDPNRAYATLQTPGYLLKLSAGGQIYQYHTDKVDTVVLCEPKLPPMGLLDSLVSKAQADLAQRLAVQLDAVSLGEATEVVWPDASLGCPQPGIGYAAMMTPGYRILLVSGNLTYEYHTDKVETVVYCEAAQPLR